MGISLVKEIRALDRVAPLPDSPEHVRGVMDLRGRVIPLIDLRSRFHLVPPGGQADGIVIVVDMADLTAGFVVDKVVEVTSLPPSSWEPPSPLVSAPARNLVSGVADISGRIIILLDLPRLLSAEKLPGFAGFSPADPGEGAAGAAAVAAGEALVPVSEVVK